jgi:hypothetical protein
LILPLAVFRKRLDAALFVFFLFLGMLKESSLLRPQIVSSNHNQYQKAGKLADAPSLVQLFFGQSNFRRLDAEHRDDTAAHELWRLLEGADFRAVFHHAIHHLKAQLTVDVLTAAKRQGKFHLVSGGKKLLDVTELRLKIMLAHIRVEFHFLHNEIVLVLPCLLLLPVFLVHELAEIHDSANRRLGIGRHFHEIQPAGLGKLERFPCGYDPDHIPIRTDAPNIRNSDLMIGSDE